MQSDRLQELKPCPPSHKVLHFTITLLMKTSSSLLTSMSPLLPGIVVAVAGTMGLLVGGAAGLGQCWGMLGETGSIFTMAGAEPRQTDWDRTTAGGKTQRLLVQFPQHMEVQRRCRAHPYRVWSGPWRTGPAG